MYCPACKTAMYVVEYSQIELDLCPSCQGTWFDRGELDLLLGFTDVLPSSAADTAEAERPCPLCDTGMEKVNIGPGRRVTIDKCPELCGLWFDRHELRELTGDLQESGWTIEPLLRDYLNEMFSQKGD